MQLKRRKKAARRFRQVGVSLATATAALLGSGAATHVHAQEVAPAELGKWELDTAALFYGESDGRVKDFSVNALVRKELKEDSFLNLTLAVDTLTGASPNGAAPSTQAQTFTRPSGGGQYVVAAGEQPLDDSFQDTRTALSANWEQPLGRLTLLNVGASASDEYDYTHFGINAKIARDFNNRNTTFSAGFAIASDTISPVGGAPIGMSPMLPSGDDGGGEGEDDGVRTGRFSGDQSKDVTDFLLGVTQVINRQTLLQINYSVSDSDGYHSDPYKLLSVVDDVTGLPVAGPLGSGLNLYLYENRPDTRQKQSLFGLIKRDIGGNTLDLSLRLMTDDWGIDSQTVDAHYRFNFSSTQYLEPHVRFYSQNAADFYHTVLLDGEPLPIYASADYRLGDFSAVTLGLKYGRMTSSGEISTRLEVYRQSGDPAPGSAFGALSGLDLYPDLTAIIAQVSYKFGR